ncbi:MAG: aspartyl/asparaginyl beta-hydroxylase domain-containing protein, partial [Gammaproteobacteria bacterium]|nr:aspartyl/asparaginyl beta-hydroxylase domain-containing protein [Gammaproteobacteria bacterium]
RHHLGLAQEAVGDLQAAAEAQAAAVQAAPQLHIARLHLGRALELLGRHSDAVVQYARALADAQQQGRWLNADTTPKPLQPIIAHAVVQVRTGRRAAFQQLFTPIQERYGADSLERVEKCLRVYFNEEAAVHPDPRQHPSFLYFPDLPTSAYLDLSMCPWLPALEARTAEVRAEMQALLPSAQGRERVFDSDELEQVNLRGLDAPPSWNGYYFYRHGVRRAENCQACPKTAAALEMLPLARIREHGPEVLYSVFTPGTHLLPHRGVTNTRLVGHLPLMVPDNCILNVGGERHQWKEGRVVVFDDTYEHEAWNHSNRTRVVMIFDIWNPNLTEAERAAVTDLIGEIGNFRHATEAA